MADKKEMTTLNASVGADAGQSFTKDNTEIIPDSVDKFNGESEFYEENSANIELLIRRMNDPDFMPVVSMEDIYGMVFTAKQWVVEGLLHTGAYILAGAPSTVNHSWSCKWPTASAKGALYGGTLSTKVQSYIWHWKITTSVSNPGCSGCSVWKVQKTYTLPLMQRRSATVWKNN